MTVGGLTRIESGSLQTVGGASFGGDVTASGNLEFGGAVVLSGGGAQTVSSTGGAVIGSGSLNKAAGDLNVSGARGVTVNGDVAAAGALVLNGVATTEWRIGSAATRFGHQSQRRSESEWC